VKVNEGKYPLNEFKNAESVWMTNSLREVQEISEVDGQRFKTNQPILKQLKNRLKEYKAEHLS